MWVDLVRMREAGVKRAKEAVRISRPERGRLTLENASSSEVTYEKGDIVPVAFFLVKPSSDPDFPCNILHRLNDAKVRIGEDSFIITGIERIHMEAGRTLEFPQAWWCRFLSGSALADASEASVSKDGASAQPMES